MEPIRLGAFVLDHPLGAGGMGEVWLGRHADTGLPVAAKLVAGELTDRMRTAFRREVEAVAALDHPGIVMVYDHGEVTDEVADAVAAVTEGRVHAGAPWLVMEHASGGTIAEAGGLTSWSGMRRQLLSVLDALAHAHARGVVHRDLKPANVLICRAADLRPGLKLADFGLATAIDRGRAHAVAGGTPAYMAPEQVLGHWWDFGPWTDLYALGGMAWAMATGTRPFPGEDGRKVGRAQVSAPLPAFVPRFAVPPELEGWLRALLDKDPARRPDRAAWCAAELLAMGTVTAEPTPAPAPDRDNATIGLYTLVPDEDLETGSDEPPPTRIAGFHEGVDPGATTGGAPPESVRPRALPPPARWDKAEAIRPYGLVTAGLGLFGLREPPFAGRVEERDRLWTALRQVCRDRAPRLVLIRGPAGLGKSRLAAWVAQRAEEVGAARSVRVPFGSGSGDLQGLPALAEHVQRSRELPIAAAVSRAWRHGDDAAAVVALARGDVVSDAPEIARRLVLREAVVRPLVLWLDDAHLDESALALARAVLDAGALGEGPILVVATVEDGALASRERATAAVDRLAARDATTTVTLGPLTSFEIGHLLAQMLPLAPAAVARVAEIAAGNPMVATQVVGAWVQAGQLRTTRAGFTPRGRMEVPRDLRQVWARRLEPLFAAWSPAEQRAVMLAAVLGQRVDEAEWVAACRDQVLAVPDAAVDDLARTGLVHRDAGSFRFTHGLVREELVDRAQRDGIARELEAACARVLAPVHTERIGRHLLAAGDDEAAFPLLLAASTARDVAEAYGSALVLADLAEGCLHRLGVDPSDPSWGRIDTRRLTILMADWQLDRVRAEGPPALARAEANGWTLAQIGILQAMGTAAFRRHELDLAEDLFGRLRVRTEPGTINEARALRGLGQVAQARGDYARALPLFERYLEIGIALGDPFLEASAHNDIGAIAVRTGRSDDAIPHLERGLALCAEHGFKDVYIARMNLIGRWVEQGRLDDAHRAALDTLAGAERTYSVFAIAAVHVLILRTSALVGDWAAWDRVASRVRTLLVGAKLVDFSVGEMCTFAGRSARDAGHPDRARLAFDLAVDQWRQMGRDAERAEVEVELAALSDVR